MSTKVMAFKTIGGEEIVAEVLSEVIQDTKMLFGTAVDSKSQAEVIAYIIKRPHVLRFQPVAPGQLGLAFVPWTLSNPELMQLTLPCKSLAVDPYEPANSVAKQYLEQTSGLDLSSRLG
jgi:hypothetical protein